MVAQNLISRYVERSLGVVWVGIALSTLLYAVWHFAASDLDSRSLILLLIGGALLLVMGLLMVIQLRGRKVLALIMSVIVGFREYTLWTHGFPDAVDMWVIRSALVFVLAVVTLVFYSIMQVNQKVP